ncbi:MAG: chemotaxis protein CheA [Bacteroidales bacterium]
MIPNIDQFRQKFLEEAFDIVDELELSLLNLEKDTTNKELIDGIFRAMHTLKGGGAMFGFNVVSEFTHHFENLFDLIRNNKIAADKDIISLTLKSVDHIKFLLKNNEELSINETEKHNKILTSIKNLVNRQNPKQDKSVPKNQSELEEITQKTSYFIKFDPKPTILNNGTNPLYLIEDVCSLGESLVIADISGIKNFEDFNPEFCYTRWYILLSTVKDISAIRDIFIFVEDECKLEIIPLPFSDLIHNDKFIDQYKAFIGNDSFEADSVLSFVNDFFSNEIKEKAIDIEKKIESGNEVQNKTATATIRVNSQKLDELMGLISELVTIQARLSLFAEDSKNLVIQNINEEFEKLTRRLRDNVLSIRLVPLDSVLIRFNRLVRELSNKTGKEIEFVVEGMDTELDKNSIELLVDPIMHIIRNAVDHGIEDKKTRIQLRKPEKGLIKLKAFYSGSNVCIDISDDGKGISVDQVYSKAVESGLINQNEKLSEREIMDLIFLPGFSTSKEITSISGRGVGMDVVKRRIADLHGDVKISSVPGQGTTISLILPLTLSIIDGLLISLDNQLYIIPLGNIDKCYIFDQSMVKGTYSNLFFTGTDYLPFVDLRNFFHIYSNRPKEQQLVMIYYGDQKIGLVVDEIVGEHQAVLKPLGKLMRKLDFISGGSILGDGTVALVIDAQKLIKRFAETENKINDQIV